MEASGYLQARVQARYAQLPEEPLWRDLEGAGDLAGYLAAARESVLAPWVRGIYARSDSDEIEQRLAARFVSTLAESAEWAPLRWRASIRGLADLVDALARAETWRSAVERWRALLPEERSELAEIESLLVAHGATFSTARPRDASLLRRQCEQDLRRLFRRTLCRPAVLFIWLTLVLLQLERLRGGLVLRALYARDSPPFGGV